MFVIDLLKKCNPNDIIAIINKNHPIDNPSKEKTEYRKEKILTVFDNLISKEVILNSKKTIFCILVKDLFENDQYYDLFFMNYSDIKNYSSEENNSKNYSLSFVPWHELLGYNVCKKSLESYGMETIIAEFIWEITFYGWTEASMEEEKNKLNESIEEYEQLKESNSLKTYTIDELFSALGYEDTRTEEEKQEELSLIENTNKENLKIFEEFIISERDCL